MHNRLKILFLGEAFSQNTISWVDGMRRLGCDVTIASGRADGSDDTRPIGPIWLPARIRIFLGASYVKKIIKEVNPDILIAYRVTSYGYLAAKSDFQPLVIAAQSEYIVSPAYTHFFRYKLLSYFAKVAVKRANLLHAWNDNMKKSLVQFGATENKILTLHRGIDLNIFFPAASPKEFDADSPVFISTRSLTPVYRIDDLIRAFKTLIDEIPGAQLKIVGSGSESQTLKLLAQTLGIDKNIQFLGRLSANILANELRCSDIYVSIVRTEGFSSSLIEACACGVFPIVVDMPASRVLIKDKETGILVDAKASRVELSDCLLSAVQNNSLRLLAREKNIKNARYKCSRDTNLKLFISEYRKLTKMLDG